MSFKVGDIVRRTDYNIEASYLSKGDEGIIIRIKNNSSLYTCTEYDVEFYNMKKHKNEKRIFSMIKEKLELVNKKKGNLGGF